MSKYLLAICKTILTFLFFVTVKVTAQPTITSFTPASGIVGTSVTITGTNFNATAVNNIVYFGAVKAIVTAATTTSLTVTAPVGATYKPISVLDNVTHLTGYSSKPFITTFTNPFGTGIPANFYKPKVDFTTSGTPYSVTFSDVDGDGKPDLVTANQTNSASVLRNISTSGSITASSFAAKVDFTPGSTPYAVATGDVDGDGKPDMVVANSSSRTLSVFRNTSTSGSITAASFAAKVDFDATGSFPTSVAIGDVDGDGKPDLMVVNGGGSTVSVFRNTSTSGSIDASSFAAKIDFATGSTPYSVTIGDVDGDGKPDIVTANQNSANISVLRNTSTSGSISAAAKVDFTTGNAPYSVAIGDVDGDGKPDLVTANNGTPYSMSVLRNTSTSGNISAAAKVDFTTATAPISAAIGDVDGDGIPEIAIANSGSNSVSVFQIDLSVTPVTLTDIKAYQKNAGVKIEWTAQQEINIDRYEIERSQDGQKFIKLGSVQAKGNSSALVKYSLFDPNPFSGVGFYRIKTIEAGQITYSRILKVNISNNSANIITISPNPVIGNIVSLQVNLPKGNYFISLTNKLGQQVITRMMHHEGGSATEGIEFPNAVTPGIYQLRVFGGGINITRQLIKN